MSAECKELQDEEREALFSIYEGDESFKQANPTTYQYKYGQDDDNKSFLVEICWGANYPNDAPIINMDTFFNRHVMSSVKKKIIDMLAEEAQQWLGCGMTYTLFEYLKDKTDEILTEQEVAASAVVELPVATEALKIAESGDGDKKASKKEHLTKAQKRRQWAHTDHKGERARGWNWVDIIKHLSQTGSKDSDVAISANITT